MEFCEAIHPLLIRLQSTVKIGFMDDVSLSGHLPTVEKDITTIVETGLRLNTHKCEIIMEDFSRVEVLPTFKDFLRVYKHEMTLLGAPVLKGKPQDTAIQRKIEGLSRAIERLRHLYMHTMRW